MFSRVYKATSAVCLISVELRMTAGQTLLFPSLGSCPSLFLHLGAVQENTRQQKVSEARQGFEQIHINFPLHIARKTTAPSVQCMPTPTRAQIHTHMGAHAHTRPPSICPHRIHTHPHTLPDTHTHPHTHTHTHTHSNACASNQHACHRQQQKTITF